MTEIINDRIILALDTSRLKGSVAVTKNDDVLCEVLFDASDTHSATLMPAIDSCMKRAGVSLDETDLLAVVDGPGSFTGLRIGVATIKALAAVGQIPVVRAGSLEVMAASFPYANGPVMPVLDARRGEIYTALYDTSGGLPVELAGPRAMAPSDIEELLREAGSTGAGTGAGAGAAAGATDGGPIVSGNGLERYSDLLKEGLPETARFALRKYWDPSAAVLAMIASTREPIPFLGLSALEPMYIRPPDAKLPGEGKLRKGGGE